MQDVAFVRRGEGLEGRKAREKAANRGMTVATVVCCSMNSLSSTR